MINTAMSWIAPSRIRPCKAVCLEIAFETTSIHFIEVRGVRIHVTNDDRRCILRTEFLPFLQEHLCDLGVRSTGRGFIMVVRQVGVEEPNYGITKPELPPRDKAFGKVVPWNAQLPTAHKCYREIKYIGFKYAW